MKNLLTLEYVLQILNLPLKIRAFFQLSWNSVEKMPIFRWFDKLFIISLLGICNNWGLSKNSCFCFKKGTFWAFVTYIVSTRNIHSYAHNSYSYVRNILCYDEKHVFLPVLTHFSALTILFDKKLQTCFCRNNSEFIIGKSYLLPLTSCLLPPASCLLLLTSCLLLLINTPTTSRFGRPLLKLPKLGGWYRRL